MESPSKESLLNQEFNCFWKDISPDIIKEMGVDESLEFEGEQLCDSTQIQQDFDRVFSNGHVPLLSNFPGDYNFCFCLRNNGSYKSSWEYSSVFNQVFIDMNKVLMVQFLYDCTKPLKEEGLYIRAMPVYCSTDYICLPVNRCTIHSIEDDPSNRAHEDEICRCLNYNLVGHVVRSQSVGALYCYDPQNRRHSVVLQVPSQPLGRSSFDILYTFSCKTSCQKGMQRRPINIIFTLENSLGEVLGRSTLGVKICSCPKRDKDRLEKDAEKNGLKNQVSAPVDTDEDLVSDREEIKARLKLELKQFHQIHNSFGKTLKHIEELFKKL